MQLLDQMQQQGLAPCHTVFAALRSDAAAGFQPCVIANTATLSAGGRNFMVEAKSVRCVAGAGLFVVVQRY